MVLLWLSSLRNSNLCSCGPASRSLVKSPTTMDVDASEPAHNSTYISFFDVSPSNFPWQEPRPEQIRLRRAALDDTLIFDILLHSGGISETYSLYPPVNPHNLQELLDTIESSHYDVLKKDCLVYFLLKWYQDGRERNFQEQRCIPPQFASLADAYWHLDTGINVPRAIAILSDARLNRDYASKIIRAISTSPDSSTLVRRYIQTAKPLLVEPFDIECYAVALADSSILEAWQFSRTFNDTDGMRTRLFRKLLEWSVTPKPRPLALSQLLALPLSTFEEDILNDFVRKPPSDLPFSSVAILQDLICVRLIQGSRYAEAIKLDRQFTSTTNPRNIKDTRDRSKMVQDVYAALPSVERALVDLDLNPTSARSRQEPLAPKPVSPETRRTSGQGIQDTSLSQSWEEVRVPEALVNKSTPLKDVRVPASTPRFTDPLQTSTATPVPAPILPINFNGIASGSKSTPRKSVPLSASVLSSARPRPSLSGVGAHMSFGTPSAIASPASGLKLPPQNGTPTQGHGHTFVSASRQQNAFYQPPPVKTNGVKRAFEDDSTNRSPERVDTMHTVDADMETEKEDNSFEKPSSRRGRKSNVTERGGDDDDNNILQYSVFGAKEKRASPQFASKASSKKAGKKAPPGTFGSEDEDNAEEDREQHEAEPQRTSARSRTSTSRSTRGSRAHTVTKPPAKKARQVKEKNLGRSIPGALMDDDDEEDHDPVQDEEEDRVAPLRAPSPPPVTRRPARKARSSASVISDEGEGRQTRRRSSRLTTGGSSASVVGGSPEPPAKTRKTKTTAGRKKR
ncbi:unnamed protein product [Cyclocybe aegerita]|uniref:ELYS-like domain-containing protein n=1 Tax=Cyclocybe aegerita TaxID=1973307 RepID=A0A8S0VSJ2_CYCAE|nr:unnamed protein product [Cyclocybe aegerita]